jgi:flavin reductase (DIM6/NTAB) family NADH-FMN oxidoreductase RutF
MSGKEPRPGIWPHAAGPARISSINTARRGSGPIWANGKVDNSSGRNIDKFSIFGVTPMPARCVASPLVAECFANLECKVIETRLVNRYNLFVLEMLSARFDPAQKNPRAIHHRGYSTFTVDGEIITLKSKMQ